MQKVYQIFIFIVLLGVVVYVAPWIFNFVSANVSNFNLDNGVFYYSLDGGKSFNRNTKGLIFNEINNLDFGPKGEIYAATNQGLFKLHSFSEEWEKLIDDDKILGFGAKVIKCLFIKEGRVLLSVNSNNRGKIYLTDQTFQKLEEVYSVTGEGAYITDLSFDQRLDRVYFSSNEGVIGLSENNGDTFRLLKRFNSPIYKIMVSPVNSYQLLVISKGEIFRSDDAGGGFSILGINDFGINTINNLYFSDSNVLFVSANNGAWKSYDGGWSWIQMDSLLPKGISSGAIAYNNKDAKILVGFDGRLYVSENGIEWKIRTISQSNSINNIKIDSANPNVILLSLIRK